MSRSAIGAVAASELHQCHDVGFLLVTELGDEGSDLLDHGIVRVIFQDIDHPVVAGVGAGLPPQPNREQVSS